jgi:formylglycine-generating enzyme
MPGKGEVRAAAFAVVLAACGPKDAPLPGSPPAAETVDNPPVVVIQPTPSASPAPAPVDEAPCPDDMAYVEVAYCDTVQLRCLRDEYEKSNHLTICHEFAPGQTCTSEPRTMRFCVDRYEYPNVKGGHPPVQVSAYDGAAMCAEKGKRLCRESEWTAACEGPEKLPFPYGLERSGTMCNIDNRYIAPSLKRAYSANAAEQDAELRRLDQSVPSGSMETCKSGFGVYDLTGNFDEWVLSDDARGKSGWAALKGGAWGHVRNACRPVTTSHPPQFTYYFISFRCCRDAGPDPAPWSPPSAPGRAQRGWSP